MIPARLLCYNFGMQKDAEEIESNVAPSSTTVDRLKMAQVQVERAKVLMESLAGFCHSLGQPATVILNSMELLRLPDTDAETRRQVIDICYDAALEIRSLLAEMKRKREYVSEAYLAGDGKAGSIVSLPEWKR